MKPTENLNKSKADIQKQIDDNQKNIDRLTEEINRLQAVNNTLTLELNDYGIALKAIDATIYPVEPPSEQIKEVVEGIKKAEEDIINITGINNIEPEPAQPTTLEETILRYPAPVIEEPASKELTSEDLLPIVSPIK